MVYQTNYVIDNSLKMKVHILYKYSFMFRMMTKDSTIQAIVTNTAEQLNIDFSITSIFPGGQLLNIYY